MARGVDGRDIYADDLDRTRFLEGMRRIARETSASVLAYCLMGNHFHLAIQVASAPLSFVMQRILCSYVPAFNHRYDRTGHLFQARHKAIVCLTDRYLARLIQYIHLNPVRAGLVLEPKDWPWSSYRPENDVHEDLSDFDPWPKERFTGPVLLRTPNLEVPDLDSIGSTVAAKLGLELNPLRSSCKERALVAGRRQFVQESIRKGYSLAAAARWLNTTRSSVSRYAHSGINCNKREA